MTQLHPSSHQSEEQATSNNPAAGDDTSSSSSRPPNPLGIKLTQSAVLTRQAKYSEAQALIEEVLAQRRQQLSSSGNRPPHNRSSTSGINDDESDPMTLVAMNNLGAVFKGQGKLAEAEALHRRVLSADRRLHPEEPENPDILVDLNNLADVLAQQGKLDEAEQLMRQSIWGFERKNGRGHPDTLSGLNNLGDVFLRQGKLKEAEALHREVLAGRKGGFGGVQGEGEEGMVHPEIVQSMNNLAAVLEKQEGKEAEAEELRRRIRDAEHGHEQVRE